MTKDDLLPCPFCGGEAKRLDFNRIGCKKCGLRTVSSQSFLKNKELWNTRITAALSAPEPVALNMAKGGANGYDPRDTVEVVLAPSPSNAELVRQIRRQKFMELRAGVEYWKPYLSEEQAASLIDGIRRTVPRKMLEEIVVACGNNAIETVDELWMVINEILTANGYTVEKE